MRAPSVSRASAGRRRARLLVGIAGVGCALAVSAPGLAVALPELPGLVYRFSAGAALFAPPGVGSDGALYVGSGEGYVHALTSDGGFRWSRTLLGRVVAPPIFDGATGRLFVATSEARLYALERDSSLRWVFPLPVAPKTELVLTAKGTLLFVGTDDHLYGVTTSGALVLRLAAPGARSAPALLQGGGAALILQGSLATLSGYGFERAPLKRAFGPFALLAVAANQAVFACENGSARVFGPGFAWLPALNRDCLSPPVACEEFLAIAESGGNVRLVYPSQLSTSFALGEPPLTPVWDAARRRLVLSTRLGSVLVVQVPSVAPRP